jgi:hypothetical protein
MDLSVHAPPYLLSLVSLSCLFQTYPLLTAIPNTSLHLTFAPFFTPAGDLFSNAHDLPIMVDLPHLFYPFYLPFIHAHFFASLNIFWSSLGLLKTQCNASS